MELLYARAPDWPPRGVRYWFYARDLANGEIYRAVVRYQDIDVDKVVRGYPDGTIVRVDASATSRGNIAVRVRPIWCPMAVSEIDALPSSMLADFSTYRDGPWLRVPCVWQPGAEGTFRVLVIGYRSGVLIDEIDLAQTGRDVRDFVRCLRDYKSFEMLRATLPRDRCSENEFLHLQSLFAGIDPQLAPFGDDRIHNGEALDYRPRHSSKALIDVVYTWLFTEPRLGGQRANIDVNEAEFAAASRVLCSLISYHRPSLIVTVGAETARILPRSLEPLVDSTGSPPSSSVFARPRHNALWELYEHLGRPLSPAVLVRQHLKGFAKPTLFVPLLDARYWGRDTIHATGVCDGYWKSAVRFFSVLHSRRPFYTAEDRDLTAAASEF